MCTAGLGVTRVTSSWQQKHQLIASMERQVAIIAYTIGPVVRRPQVSILGKSRNSFPGIEKKDQDSRVSLTSLVKNVCCCTDSSSRTRIQEIFFFFFFSIWAWHLWSCCMVSGRTGMSDQHWKILARVETKKTIWCCYSIQNRCRNIGFLESTHHRNPDAPYYYWCSMVSLYVGAHWSLWWALQSRLSRLRWGRGLGWAKGTMF